MCPATIYAAKTRMVVECAKFSWTKNPEARGKMAHDLRGDFVSMAEYARFIAQTAKAFGIEKREDLTAFAQGAKVDQPEHLAVFWNELGLTP